ncbi:MAG: hypothetical protein ABFE07_11090 [Armatimonadia bacterium]
MCLVVDANVWFDLFCGNLHYRVLDLKPRVVAVDVVVAQLKHSPDGQALLQQGLQVRTVDGEGVKKAYEWRTSNPCLEVPDVFSLALAWRNGWQLATRDGSLRALAEEEGIAVLNTCHVLSLMAGSSLLREIDLICFKREMSKQNRPYLRSQMRDVERIVKAGN